MLALIHAPVPADPALPEVCLRADRITLAKRLWRGRADDGAEFGFDLSAPLADGATFFEAGGRRYVVRQEPEPVVSVSLDLAPSAAAAIGWAVGNLHLSLSAEPERLLAPDEPAVRALLERLGMPYERTTAVFRPGRFARDRKLSHELGPSHRH